MSEKIDPTKSENVPEKKRLVIGAVCGKDVVLEGQALEVYNEMSEEEKKKFVDSTLYRLLVRHNRGEL